MHTTNSFAFFILFFSFFHACASSAPTHLDKISKHLFFIKPDYSTPVNDDTETVHAALVADGTELDKKSEMELAVDVIESDDEASSAIDETELSKALAAKCGTQSSVSNLDIAHLTQILMLTEELKKAHAEFLRRMPKQDKTRTQKCLVLIDSLALYENDPQFKAKEFTEFREEFEKRYPTKFMKMKSLANECGLQSAHDKLSQKIGTLKNASPFAADVLTAVFKEKGLHSVGELIRFAKPVSDN